MNAAGGQAELTLIAERAAFGRPRSRASTNLSPFRDCPSQLSGHDSRGKGIPRDWRVLSTHSCANQPPQTNDGRGIRSGLHLRCHRGLCFRILAAPGTRGVFGVSAIPYLGLEGQVAQDRAKGRELLRCDLFLRHSVWRSLGGLSSLGKKSICRTDGVPICCCHVRDFSPKASGGHQSSCNSPSLRRACCK